MENRITAGIMFAVVVGMIFFFGGQLQSELAPLEDRSWFRLLVTAPEGASYEYTDRHMSSISTYVMDSVPEKRIALTVTAPGFAGSGAVNTGFGRVMLSDPEERNRSQQEIVDQVSGYLRKLPTAKTFAVQEQTISAGGGPRGSLPVQFVLQTSDYNKLKMVLPKFMKEVAADPVFQGNDVNLKFNKPELQISIDREKAKSLGLSVRDVAQTLQLAFSGQRFAYFQKDGKQYQVIGQFDRANRDEPADLRMIYLRNAQGQLIQLDNVVTLEEQSNPPQLYHYNRFKSATVSAGLARGRTIGDGVEAMQKIADRLLDDSFSTALTGASRDYAESSSNALYAFLLALLIIYLILAAQFESFIDPFIIICTVPLALGGAVFALWYFNQTLNIFSQIGMIMLIGLVTKNGIMIVEFANQLREDGKQKYDAIVEASVLRLRPILMTSIATILGALPIAMALGAGAKSRIPMGVVIVGGLLFALVLTLYLIPVIYQTFSRRKQPISTETYEN
jgi:multidrug efflux pump